MCEEREPTPICNFDYYVTGLTKQMGFYGETISAIVHLKLQNSFNEADVTVAYDKLDNIDFGHFGHQFVVDETIAGTKKKIVYDLKLQAAEIEPTEEYILDKLGWYAEGDRVCYNAGDRIITHNTTIYKPDPKLAKEYELEIIPDCDERNAIFGAFKVMNIDKRYSPMIFAAGTLGIMRDLILKAGIRPASAIYVVGETQNRKTSLTTLCTRLYNRSMLISDSTTSMARVNSSYPMLEKLIEENKDCAFVLDDLFRNPDPKMKREAEHNVRQILREYADNSPRRNMRAQCAVNSQLVITAEYLLDSITDLGRCFLIHIDDTINSDRLTPMQNEPLLVSTFYFYFIRYLCAHYYETIERIKHEFQLFRQTSSGHKGHYERVYETGFLMSCVFGIICDYAIQKKVLSKEAAAKMSDDVKNQINNMIDFHSYVMDLKSHNSNDVNYCRAIKHMLATGALSYGEKGSDCFLKNNCTYVKYNTLTAALYKTYAINVSKKKLSSYFSGLDISKGYNSPGNQKNVMKYDKKTYLVLDMAKLDDEAFREKDPIQKIL